MSRRTKAIIASTTNEQEDVVVEDQDDTQTKRRLVEAEATAIYLCVLVKCFKIDEHLRQQ